jgi:hypothetical protein
MELVKNITCVATTPCNCVPLKLLSNHWHHLVPDMRLIYDRIQQLHIPREHTDVRKQNVTFSYHVDKFFGLISRPMKLNVPKNMFTFMYSGILSTSNVV